MADVRRFGPTDFVLLLVVLAVAAGARVGYLVTFADNARTAGPLRVQDEPTLPPGAANRSELAGLIQDVRDTGTFASAAPFSRGEEPTAHIAPGYPWLVGVLARIVPSDNLDSTVRWVQAGLGALTAALYYLFARRAFRNLAVGVLAGLFTALNPFWVIDTAAINDGVVVSFALAVCLFLGSLASEEGGALSSLLFGLALAGLALVRAAMLPFAFVAVVWFLLRSRSLQRGWLCALLAFLGFANGLAPWTVRNLQVFDEPLPVVSSTYLHLWAGNNPHATGGPPTLQAWQSAPTAELEQTASQPKRYALLGRIVADEVRNKPALTLQRRMRAALVFLFGGRWLSHGELAEKTSDAETPEWMDSTLPIVLQGTLLGMFALGLLGWRWSFGWRWESAVATLAVLWIPLPYILSCGEALSGPRLPLDGIFLCYAAVALVGLLPGVQRGLVDGADAGPATLKPAPR